jgi:Porin subfamily
MNKILTATLLCLALSPVRFARAGDASSQNSLFLPSGKSEAMQALEAKKNARCAALYGPGYGALGDSDTCIRVGGRVGVTIGVSTKQNKLLLPSQGIGAPAPSLGGPAVTVVRQPKTGSATSADVYVDTRTQTEIGEIGTHVSVGAVRATGALVGPNYVH